MCNENIYLFLYWTKATLLTGGKGGKGGKGKKPGKKSGDRKQRMKEGKRKKSTRKPRKSKGEEKKKSGKGKKSKAGRKRGGNTLVRQSSTCSEISCLNNLLQVLKVDKDTVQNFIQQKKRMESKLGLLSNKNNKSSNMNASLEHLAMALGGNQSLRKDSEIETKYLFGVNSSQIASFDFYYKTFLFSESLHRNNTPVCSGRWNNSLAQAVNNNILGVCSPIKLINYHRD